MTRRSVREYLDKLDDAAWGAASEVVPKFISPSDLAAQWTGAHKGHAFFAYADNYLIDLKAAIIVDVEATRASRRAEVGPARTMIDRTEACFGLKPQRLSADSAYGSAEILAWMVEEKNIAPHVPVWDKSERDDGTFSRSDFVFDAVSNTYTCPGGKILRQYRRPYTRRRSGVTKQNMRLYEPANPTARRAPSRTDAVPDSRTARCPGVCMRLRATRPGALRRRPNMSSHAASGRRSRCSSPISRHPQAQPPTIARAVGRQGRVSARRDRPKPAQTGQTDRTAATVDHINRSIAAEEPNGRSANRHRPGEWAKSRLGSTTDRYRRTLPPPTSSTKSAGSRRSMECEAPGRTGRRRETPRATASK